MRKSENRTARRFPVWAVALFSAAGTALEGERERINRGKFSKFLEFLRRSRFGFHFYISLSLALAVSSPKWNEVDEKESVKEDPKGGAREREERPRKEFPSSHLFLPRQQKGENVTPLIREKYVCV